MPSDNKGALADSLMGQLGKKLTPKRLKTEDIDLRAIAQSAAHQLSPSFGRFVKTLWRAGNVIEAKPDTVELQKKKAR
jgi:hypothetical protein